VLLNNTQENPRKQILRFQLCYQSSEYFTTDDIELAQ